MATLSLAALGGACTPTTDAPPPATEASADRLVEAGRDRWSSRRPDDLLAARELFRRAIELDPELASAWSGLADASALLGLYSVRPAPEVMPEALRAADRALTLDPDNAATHASRGLALYLHDWDFVAAEQAFRRAIELDPEQVNAHHWFGMMLSVLGRHDEALSHMRAAAQRAPESALLATKIGTLQSTAGRLEAARATLVAADDRFSGSPLPQRELGYVALADRRADEAIGHFLAALRLATEDPNGGPLEFDELLDVGDSKLLVALALALQRSGQESADPQNAAGAAGSDAATVIEALRGRADRESWSPLTRARLEVAAGAPDEALVWLERAFAQRDPGIVYLRTKPSFEALETDARFLALCHRIGI